MKKFIIIYLIIAIIISFGGFFILRSEPVSTYLWKHSRSYEREIYCFASMPYKCGLGLNMTDESIVFQIKSWRITKEEARDLILNAQANPNDYIKTLKNKEVLTVDEKRILEGIPVYYKRMLNIIDNME